LGIAYLRGWDEDPINKFDTQLISKNVDHTNSRLIVVTNKSLFTTREIMAFKIWFIVKALDVDNLV
jgi:hypothetical protein